MEADIWADFNDIDEAGLTTTLAKTARDPSALHRGGRLVVGDGEGNFCTATVADVLESGLVVLKMDFSTFKPATIGVPSSR